MKLQGTKANETPDQTIIRCANNLVKAVLAAGYSMHSTEDVSGVDIGFYKFLPNKICIKNIISEWEVKGNTPLKITFKQPMPENDLTQDDAAAMEGIV